MHIINDVRKIEEFKGKTFSGYKLTDVKKSLINSIQNNNIEQICYWTCEMICACHYIDLWDLILLYMSKHIHTGNAKLPIYIELRYCKFREIINNGYLGYEIKLRNNETVRYILLEIMFVLSYSCRRHELKRVKIDKGDFNMDILRNRFKADSLEYAKKVFKSEDAKDFFIAINELIYHLEKTKDLMSVCYWVEWILNFELQCKTKPKCAIRDYPVQDKYKTEIIWIIWDILKIFITNKKCLESLITLFTIKYTSFTKRKRVFLIYFAIYLVLDKVDFSVPIIKDKNKIKQIVNDSDKMFKHIKKGEVLSRGKHERSGEYNEGYLESSLKKLEIMNNLNI